MQPNLMQLASQAWRAIHDLENRLVRERAEKIMELEIPAEVFIARKRAHKLNGPERSL